ERCTPSPPTFLTPDNLSPPATAATTRLPEGREAAFAPRERRTPHAPHPPRRRPRLPGLPRTDRPTARAHARPRTGRAVGPTARTARPCGAGGTGTRCPRVVA